MITTVIFDLGNVLVSVDNARVLPLIAAYLKKPVDLKSLERMVYYGYHEPESDTEVFFSDIQRRFHLGELSAEQFYQALVHRIGFSGEFTFERFQKIWPARFERNEETIALLRSLGKYTKYLLSDTNELDARYLQTHHGDIFREFDRVFFSYVTRTDKNTMKAWKHVLEASGKQPLTHVYIDDRAEFVQRAQRLGMQGIVYAGAEDLRKQLVSLGIMFTEPLSKHI